VVEVTEGERGLVQSNYKIDKGGNGSALRTGADSRENVLMQGIRCKACQPTHA